MDEFEYKYIVFFSCKDDAGVVNDHPLRPFVLQSEAEIQVEGYVDAIINHTEEEDPDMIKGLFRITKIGEEGEQKEISKENKKKNSINETA